MNTLLLVTLAVITISLLLVLLFLIGSYNKFVVLRNAVNTDFSDVDVQVKRRSALVQSLVDLVKDYAKHENETFTNVAKARSAIETSENPHEVAKADNMLTQTLKSLVMLTEDYPDLKANENYEQLNKDLLQAENLVANYRERYNQTVENYNNNIQMFPALIAAFIFNFKEAELFSASDEITK